MKFEFNWIDMYKMSQCQRNRVRPVTLDDINDNVLNYLTVKYCYQCEKSKQCHDDCVKCDDMVELLEKIGFEI